MRKGLSKYPTFVALTAFLAFVAMHPRQGAYSDPQLLALLDEANVADSSAAAFAEAHANNPDVRDYARMMQTDHHALRAQGQALAKQLNITPAPPPPERDPVKNGAMREMTAMMSAGTGGVFDKAYVDQEVAIHMQVIDLLNKAHPQHPELERLMTQAMPVLQKHLAKAREVETKLGQPKT